MFIKCVKPNRDMRPDQPKPGYILPQLHSQGVLHAVTVAKQGYPHRFKCDEIYQKFGPMIDSLVQQKRVPKELANQQPRDLVRAVLDSQGSYPTPPSPISAPLPALQPTTALPQHPFSHTTPLPHHPGPTPPRPRTTPTPHHPAPTTSAQVRAILEAEGLQSPEDFAIGKGIAL